MADKTTLAFRAWCDIFKCLEICKTVLTRLLPSRPLHPACDKRYWYRSLVQQVPVVVNKKQVHQSGTAGTAVVLTPVDNKSVTTEGCTQDVLIDLIDYYLFMCQV